MSESEKPTRSGTHHLGIGPGREFDLVRQMLATWGDRAAGIGDDAAILDVPHGEKLVVSTDVAVHRVHFRDDWISDEEIGFKSTMAALSDIAAMGARPLGVLAGLTVPESWVNRVPALARGIGEAAALCGAPVVGGDMTSGAELALAMTALGTSARPCGRDGARPGDIVYVTGVLGGALAAIKSWKSGVEPEAKLRQRYARPRARIHEAIWLARHGAHSMIDISDGLGSELQHIAHASNAGIHIDASLIPCWPGVDWALAVVSGEEYELLVTAPAEIDQGEFERQFDLPLSRIGEVRSAGSPNVEAQMHGQRVDLNLGHDHFSH